LILTSILLRRRVIERIGTIRIRCLLSALSLAAHIADDFVHRASRQRRADAVEKVGGLSRTEFSLERTRLAFLDDKARKVSGVATLNPGLLRSTA
jgi:hypothetical protein